MNMNASGYQAYKKVQVQTADQGTLILLCYDGCINALKLARTALTEGRTDQAAPQLQKAQNIIWELINGLNYDAGEIAQNLGAIYNYMIRRLMDSEYHLSTEPVDEVLEHLEEMRQAWQTIINKQG